MSARTRSLEQTLRNWQEKLAHYEYELAISASAEKKFELRKSIEECYREIERLIKGVANTP